MKKLVFAMIEAGGGHKAPAQAIMEALSAEHPGKFDMEMLDFIKDIGCVELDAKHKRSWTSLLGRPRTTNFLHYLQDAFGPAGRTIVYRSLAAAALPAAIKWLRETKPDIVFSTHYLVTGLLVRARKATGQDFTLITYQTEIFTYHALWRSPDSDWYLTASRQAADKAIRAGIAADKVRSFPYPIPPSFLESRRERPVVARELGLDPSRKTILFSFGGQGAGDVMKFLGTMVDLDVAMNVIIVTGRNEALRKSLEEMEEIHPRLRIVPIGFATNMNELIEVSDICFIKPGPATMMECMHSRKPIIFSRAATPCEQAHADFAVGCGVARLTSGNKDRFARALGDYLKPGALQEAEARYEAMALPNGAGEVARFLAGLARGD